MTIYTESRSLSPAQIAAREALIARNKSAAQRSAVSKASKGICRNPKGRGKGNKNKKPAAVTEAVLNRYKNHPPPRPTPEAIAKVRAARVGLKFSEEWRANMSLAQQKRVESPDWKYSMPYQGKYRPNNPQKYDGDPTNIIYRSSLELRFMQYLDSTHDVLKWQSEEFCIPYFDPATNRVRRYFPDFLVVVKRGEGTLTQLIEIKPAKQCEPPKVPPKKTKRFIHEMLTYGTNQAKWRSAEEYCKDRNWKFKIITEKDLGIR